MEYTKVGIPVGSFAALGSPLKVRLYRQNGATIEQVVTIEKGGVLLSGNIHIGQGSVIGPNCRFECEQLSIGKIVQFNGDSEVISRQVNIGDVSYFEKGGLVGDETCIGIKNLLIPS